MRYAGGKFRVGKGIARILSAEMYPGRGYLEPFVGGGWSLYYFLKERHADGPVWASDANPYLIAMWQRLQEGWRPLQGLEVNLGS